MEELEDELIDAKHLAVDEGRRVLVWTGTLTEGNRAGRKRRNLLRRHCLEHHVQFLSGSLGLKYSRSKPMTSP